MTSELLSDFFKGLNKERISYCVLKSYEYLPKVTGNDLDIWVERGDSVKFKKILLETANAFDWSVIKPNVSPRLGGRGEGKYYLVNNMPPFKVVHLDTWTYPYWRGIPYIDQKVLGSHRSLYKNSFYVSPCEIEIAISLLGDLLHSGEITKGHKDRITQCLNNDFNEVFFVEMLKRLLRKRITKRIIDFARAGDWAELEKEYNSLRLELIVRSFCYNPFGQIRNWFLYFFRGSKDLYFRRYGVLLVFLGPDGTGKTTVAQGLLNSEFADRLFKQKFYFHTNFPILPRLRKIGHSLKLLSHDDREPENVNRQLAPLPTIRSIIYPIYYALNYVLGHFWLWKKKSNGGSLIVFDRYFYEYLIQPTFLKCPRWLLKLIHMAIPKPDILMLIKSRPEVIYSRKRELPLHETQRQLQECEAIVNASRNGFLISNYAIQHTVNQVKKIAIDRLKI